MQLYQFDRSAPPEGATAAFSPPPSSGTGTPEPATTLEKQQRAEQLVRTIEGEIIPRLVLAHCQSSPSMQPDPSCPLPTATEIQEFVGLVRGNEIGAAAQRVRAFQARGLALELIYLHLLAPAARQMGSMWETDECDFTEVTLGLWRIQQLVLDLSPEFTRTGHETRERGRRSGRVLLAAAPGSRHTFGVGLLAEFFKRAGWDVTVETQTTMADLLERVRECSFDVVGLSVSTEGELTRLPALILGLRRSSRQSAIGVMVGGPVFHADPGRAAQVGADCCATDATQALADAEKLLSLREARCPA